MDYLLFLIKVVIKTNQMSVDAEFQAQVVALLQQQYPDIRINTAPPAPEAPQSLYTHSPNPQLSIGELRQVAETAEARPNEAVALAQRIYRFMGTLIATLENNEACRLSWVPAFRGRTSEPRAGLRELEGEMTLVGQLVEECKHGVTCKSHLADLLRRRRTELFRRTQQGRAGGLRQLQMPQMPQNYEHLPLLSEDSYAIVYESILQKLLVYQNAVGQFLNGELGMGDFQRVCGELMRQDIVLLNNNKTNELIRYTWYYCTQQYFNYFRLKARLQRIRHLLTHSLLRAYYIAFLAKPAIQQLEDSLRGVEARLGGGAALGRNSVGGGGGQDVIGHLQANFTRLFSYLTDKRETVFLGLYQRKLKKRVVRLMQIEDRLTHFYKIIFNPDYAELHLNAQQQKQQSLNRVEEGAKRVRQMWEEMRPMSDRQFRAVFEEVQQLGMLVEQTKAGRQWQYKVCQLERTLMQDYLFENGHRKARKDPLSSSRVQPDLNRSFNSYKVTQDEVFEDGLQEINQKRPTVLSQPKPEEVDPRQALKEGQHLLESIRPEFGEELLDLSNFKAYLLPKLTRQAEVALSRTPYSEQPLNLNLTSLSDNLRLLPSIIKPEVNEKKIDLIFFPKVNSQLFSTLKALLLKHQEDLSNAYLQITNNPIKANNLPTNIKAFMEVRLRYLHALLENIDKLEEIALCVDGLNLRKTSHDIASQATAALLLKLLLAAKELTAYQQALRDRTGPQAPSPKALRLLSEFIYPNFLNSLLLLFQHSRMPQSLRLLQTLLQVSQASTKVMVESEEYMETVVRMMEEAAMGRSQANSRMLAHEYLIALKAFNSRAEQLIGQSQGYACINSDTLTRQRIRILEFLQLLQNGPSTNADIIDDKSKRLRNCLARLSL